MTDHDEIQEQYSGWAILEVMGRRRIIGYLTREEICGRDFVRMDIAADPPFTQFYGPDSVYCITPVTEETAKAASALNRVAPISRWELPSSPVEAEIVDDDDDRDSWDQPLPFDASAGTRL
jgi:hypothetical protein